MRHNIIIKNQPVVQAIAAQLAPAPSKFVGEIYANDDRFLAALQEKKGHFHQGILNYYNTGKSIASLLFPILDSYWSNLDQNQQAVRLPSLQVLEFGCGGGQLTRFLLDKMPRDRFSVCDSDAIALNFVKENFPVKTILHPPSPPDFITDSKFDCIIAVNLPENTTNALYLAWLEKLYSLLNTAGMLIFTTGNYKFLRSQKPDIKLATIYSLTTENYYPARPDPALTYVSPIWFKKHLKKLGTNKIKWLHFPQGLSHKFDLWILIKPDLEVEELTYQNQLNNLQLIYPPVGALEKAEITDSETFTLSGYAFDHNEHGKITDIQVMINGKIKQRCLPYIVSMSDGTDHNDLTINVDSEAELNTGDTIAKLQTRLSGWQCELAKELIELDDIIVIKIFNNLGQNQIIFADYVKTLIETSPVPPSHLLHDISGSTDPIEFSQSFANVRYSVKKYLRQVQHDFSQFTNILDFGCGVGRFILAWQNYLLPHQKISGCDVSSESAQWCQAHIKSAPIINNHLYPPLPYANSQFDLVYATSVWTHLRLDLQHLWAWEMFRILEPGGILLTTIHGVSFFPHIWQQAKAWENSQLDVYSCGDDGIFLHLDYDGSEKNQGQNEVATAHTPAFCQEIFVMFNLLGHFPYSYFANGQDLYIWQKPMSGKTIAQPAKISPDVNNTWQISDRLFPEQESSIISLTFDLQGQQTFRVYPQFDLVSNYVVECDIEIRSSAETLLGKQQVSFGNHRIFGKTHYNLIELKIPEYHGQAIVNLQAKISQWPANFLNEFIEVIWNFANFF